VGLRRKRRVKVRTRRLTLLLSLVAVAFTVGPLTSQASAFDLMLSRAADRSAPVLLDGQTVSDNIYVFTSPSTGTTRVQFYLDDPARVRTPIKTEASAPWDFAGTASNTARSALPYDSKRLANGVHSITAAITKSAGGTDVLTGNFIVSNTTTPNPQPQPCNPMPCPDALMLSSTASRAVPVTLDGAGVSGNVYVFVASNTGITQVRFYLDDPGRTRTPIKTEASAPWDFAGTASDTAKSALPYDSTRLTNGPHSITAAITRSTGINVVTGNFMVTNSTGTPGADLLPDLVADPPTSPLAPGVMRLADGQDHLLIKFNGSIHNIGAGAFEIRGSFPVNGTMTVTGQRIYRQGGGFRDDNSRDPIIALETSDGHNHWHLMSAARFSLWNQTGTVEVAPGAKVGFCLEDGQTADSFAVPTPAYSGSRTQYCRSGQAAPTDTFQGVSSGWRDVYGSNVYFQWVDISDTAPGLYRLGSQMDPDNFALESNETNNGPTLASSNVAVPGYKASPVNLTVSGSQAITLASQQFGSPGARRFKIETPPEHGSLSVATGTAFVGPQVTYTPNSGYSGPDAFSYMAYDSASAYPLHPPTAMVDLTVQP
jgi:hypothetical protein